jgi:fumarate reductase subunit C
MNRARSQTTIALPAANAAWDARLWLAQRLSAMVLAVCVVVHLATMILVVRQGLSAEAILGRTRGSGTWAAFYALFVIAVSVHAPIGLRTVLGEWMRWRGRGADLACALVGIALLLLGLRALAAVALS